MSRKPFTRRLASASQALNKAARYTPATIRAAIVLALATAARLSRQGDANAALAALETAQRLLDSLA